MPVRSDPFGERQYRRGALERLAEAGVLLRRGFFGASRWKPATICASCLR
jgi:hypothetical protein